METKVFTIKNVGGIYMRSIVFLIVNIIVLFNITLGSILFLVTFDVIYLWVLYGYPTTVKASIGHDKLTVSKCYFLKDDTDEEYDLSEVDFSYRKAMFGKGRSYEKRDVLTIYHKEQFVFDLEPGENGWNDGAILDVIAFLKELGLKQTVEKYSDNEIEV